MIVKRAFKHGHVAGANLEAALLDGMLHRLHHIFHIVRYVPPPYGEHRCQMTKRALQTAMP